jgi:hypothetical protein
VHEAVICARADAFSRAGWSGKRGARSQAQHHGWNHQKRFVCHLVVLFPSSPKLPDVHLSARVAPRDVRFA